MTQELERIQSVSKSNELTLKKKNLEVRSRLLMAIRTFFHDNNFIEVETPILLRTPALEDYIDAIVAGKKYLRTSPELHMKRLIAAGYEKIFQIGACFREGELGHRHRPEFTMLEWYEQKANYLDILQRTENLIQTLSANLNLRTAYFSQDFAKMSVSEAFLKFAKIDVNEAIANGNFEEILCEEVEPHLGINAPLFLIDYPASMAALSRKKKDNPSLAERWELYIDGVEIANAYSELTDAKEQRQRFIESAELRRKNGRQVYEIDEEFLKALEDGLPDCGGIALGIDRLCMVLVEAEDISQVVFE